MVEFGNEVTHNMLMHKVWLENINEENTSDFFSDEEIFSVANTRLGLYRQASGHVVNFLLSPKILAIKKKDRPGLVNPLIYYLS